MMISFFLEGGLQPLPNKISRWLDPQGYCKLHNIWQCPFTIFFPTAEGGFWPKSQRMLCTSGYRCSAKSSTFRSKPSQVAKRLSNLSDTTFDPPFLWTFLYSQTVFKQACLQHIYKQAYKQEYCILKQYIIGCCSSHLRGGGDGLCLRPGVHFS